MRMCVYVWIFTNLTSLNSCSFTSDNYNTCFFLWCSPCFIQTQYQWINEVTRANSKRGDVLDSIDWLMEAKSPILVLDVSDQASSMCKIRETHGKSNIHSLGLLEEKQRLKLDKLRDWGFTQKTRDSKSKRVTLSPGKDEPQRQS